MKLIHCADVHLDSPMQTHMTAQQASVRNTEMLQSFVRLTEFAQERAVRAVLIARDAGMAIVTTTIDAVVVLTMTICVPVSTPNPSRMRERLL